jgi:hypothetical protein
MAVTEVFTGVAAADYDSALGWYERLMGRPPDVLPKEHEAGWEVSESGWIYLVDDADRAGKAMLTLVVDDLEGLVGNVAERGLEPGMIETLPGVVRTTRMTDPAGNTLIFAEDLGEDSAG